MPAQGHQIERHTHAVVIDLNVFLAQPRDPHHGVGVVQHTVDHAVDGAGHGIHVQRVAAADVVDQRIECVFARLECMACPWQLVLHGALGHAIVGELETGVAQLRNVAQRLGVALHFAVLGQVIGDPEQHPLQHALVVVLAGVGILLDHLPEAVAGLARDAGVGTRFVAAWWTRGGCAQNAGRGLFVGERAFFRGILGTTLAQLFGCGHGVRGGGRGGTVGVNDGGGRFRGQYRPALRACRSRGRYGGGAGGGGGTDGADAGRATGQAGREGAGVARGVRLEPAEVGVGNADGHGHAGRRQLQVDVDVVAVAYQRVQFDLVVDQEALQQERRIEPRPVQLHDEHVQSEIMNGDPVTAVGRHRWCGLARLIGNGGQGKMLQVD